LARLAGYQVAGLITTELQKREAGEFKLIIFDSLIVKPETSHVESSRPVVTFHASHPKSVRWPDKSPSLRHQRNGILISISSDLFWISDQPELVQFILVLPVQVSICDIAPRQHTRMKQGFFGIQRGFSALSLIHLIKSKVWTLFSGVGVWGSACHTFRVTCGFLLK
jgi:hypothetical protein